MNVLFFVSIFGLACTAYLMHGNQALLARAVPGGRARLLLWSFAALAGVSGALSYRPLTLVLVALAGLMVAWSVIPFVFMLRARRAGGR